MTQISLPRGSGETGVNEWSDVYSNDNAITTVVNGQLSNDNVASNAAIAHSKLAAGTAGQLLIANASGVITATTASGDVTVGGTGAVTIANNAVTTAKINDSAVTTAKINDSAVTTAKVNDGAITSAKIADATIATADLANTAVTTAKLAADAVTSGKAYFYSDATYSTIPSSITSQAITSDTTTLASLTSVPAGTYLVIATLQVSTTGNAGDLALYLWAKATSGVLSGTFTGGTTVTLSGVNQGNYVVQVNDPGPTSNLKLGLAVSGILSMTATDTVSLKAIDPAGESTRISSGLTLIGLRS